MTFVVLDQATATLHCRGKWTLAHLMALKKSLQQLILPSDLQYIDAKEISTLDSSGAWVLQQWLATLTAQGYSLQLKNLQSTHYTLLKLLQDYPQANVPVPRQQTWPFLPQIGKQVVDKAHEFQQFLAFIGEMLYLFWRWILKPQRIAWRSCLSVFEQAGVRALPILALLSFLIGVVLTYQMALQLQHYGANIYVVDLLGLTVLREFSPLMTAIIVAARTGSAFTAQLGTMKIREEIDALSTMGIAPGELLVLPKLLGLMLILPLLTVWSSMFAIFGGMVIAHFMLSISYQDFLHRFYEAISVHSYYAGLIKAPVFGMVIAAIGCFQGMRVSGSATSVGTKTTLSVVQAVFFVIVIDALFSILFNWVHF